MKKYHFAFLSLLATCTCVWADSSQNQPTPKQLCTQAWYDVIEKQLPTADARKQGPDTGSDEWKAAIERKLNVHGKPDVPARDNESWCRYIDQLVHAGSGVPATEPSASCQEVRPDSIQALICNDKELSMLDRKLSSAYSKAGETAKNRSTLAATQREWVRGRDDCRDKEDKGLCVRDAYFRRIAELQAIYRLVPGIGPSFYQCHGQPGGEVTITLFATDPRTLVAEFNGSSSLMYIVPSASEVRYQGRNETFWELEGEAGIVWGNGAPEMRCKKAP